MLRAAQDCADAYAEHIGVAAPDGTNTLLLEALVPLLPKSFAGRIGSPLGEKPFIVERIRARAPANALFRQPAVLLVYLLLGMCPAQTRARWPLTEAELEPVCTDLGISMPGL